MSSARRLRSSVIADADELDDSAQHIKRGSIVVDDYDEEDEPPCFSWYKLWKFSGPGWLMSIAYLDPGNLESDLQAGAQTGYTLMWVLWWSTVIGLVLQILSARLGVVTGLNLAQICRKKYSRTTRYALWILMELAVITSDIQEVIGSALAIGILSNGKIPLWGGALITGIDTFTFLLLERYGLRKLEALFAVLITTMAFTFGYMFYAIGPPTKDITEGTLLPKIESHATEQATGILGAVIMPHNLYLHSALVLSRKINTERRVEINEANKYYLAETGIALFVSFIINMFVVAVFASGFTSVTDEDPSKYDVCRFSSDDPTVNYCSGSNVDLAHAGCCLGQRFNVDIKYIWAIGLLAAGQSSTMTGTYAGQFIMEGFLLIKIAPWKRVMLTRTIAMIPTVAVAMYASPSTLGSLNEWMNVAQSMLLPFALVPLMHFTSIRSIMNEYTNGMTMKILGWIFALVIIAVNLATLTMQIDFGAITPWEKSGILLVASSYTLFVLYLMLGPLFPWKGNYMMLWYTAVADTDPERAPLLSTNDKGDAW
eukprot:m.429203 g.429203  ORF g.429203 m.429203 type:complete len:542 (-) comp21386_c0_seq2:400-2025(-)